MSGGLQEVGDDGARCTVCGALAVGPCASCQAPLCGDCCVITRGAKVWAICPRCDGRGKSDLASPWRGLLVWLGGLLIGLALLVAMVGWLAGR